MPYSPAVAQARAAFAIHSRWHADDIEGVAERRRTFVAEKLADHIERTLADETLTDEQTDRLVAALRAAGRGDAR